MISKMYKVLAIEDSQSDAKLIAASLENVTLIHRFDLVHVATLDEGIRILEGGLDIDVLLLDLNLPDSSGIETFYKVHKLFPDLPIIILTSTTIEESYINAIDEGAQDFVAKDSLNYNLLTKSICNAHRRMQIRCQLQRATKMKSEFLSHMSHEIRTPLNGVIGLTDLLLATNLDAKQRQLASLARESGELLLAIVNDILDISKIESGKIELDVSHFDFVELVQSCVSVFKASLEAKNLNFSLILPDESIGVLGGDSTKIRQILINLLNNAVKFTAQGSVTLRIELMENKKPGLETLKFFIIDTGIGIPAEKIQELFTPFSQAERSTARRFGGTGLGLAISHAFVNLMGGQLTVNSSVGDGSTFSFSIDLFRPPGLVSPSFDDSQEVQDQGGGSNGMQNEFSKSADRGHSTSTQENALIGAGRKALIVEDNFVNQTVLDAMMCSLGFDVKLAKSGSEALSFTSQTDFDVILMDCQMPEMDGFEATRKIRDQQKGSGKRTPILAISAGASCEERDLCHISGMDGFLSKPIKLAVLDSALHKYFQNFSHSKLNHGVIQQEVIRDLWSLGKRVGRDVLGEVFDIFEKRTAPMMADIQRSLQDGDRIELGRLAHALKGSAMHFGATEMVSICEEIEKWSPSEKAMEKEILLEKLQRSVKETTSALRDEISRINR